LVNNYVARTHSRALKFSTLFFGLLDPTTGSLVYLNAGHEPPLILTAGRIRASLEPGGPVVGLFPGIEFKIQAVQLELGELLLAFTDGVTDALNPSRIMFSKERLLALLSQPASSAAALLDHIETHLHNHIAGADQYDDITMLAVRRELLPKT
jgi:sigma-B regulation protein RsbU (phosphoserine phosphatase)